MGIEPLINIYDRQGTVVTAELSSLVALDLALALHAGGAGPNILFPAVLEWLDKERQRLGDDVITQASAGAYRKGRCNCHTMKRPY
jgi:hypothetical protein